VILGAEAFSLIFPKKNDNADIALYRGYAEWIAILGKNDNFSLALIGRTGSHFDRGSLETNLSFPSAAGP